MTQTPETIQHTMEDKHDPVRGFLDEVQLVSAELKDELKDGTLEISDPNLVRMAHDLEYLGLDVSTGMTTNLEERYTTDRRTRDLLTELYQFIETTNPDERDEDIQALSLRGVTTLMQSFGIQTASGHSKEKGPKTPDPEAELLPNVDETMLSELAKTEQLMAQKKYPTDQVVKALAEQFLDVFHTAQTEKEKGASGQRKVDLIGQTNAYAHTFGRSLMLSPENMRPKMWADIKGYVTQAVELKTGRHIPHDQEGRVPELKNFHSMLKGVQLEVESFVELQKHFSNVRASEMNEDILEGFDIVFTDSDGVERYLDTKSKGSFNEASNKNRITVIENGVAYKVSRSGKNVIVVDVQTRGHNGIHSNKFALDNPQDFLRAIETGIYAT